MIEIVQEYDRSVSGTHTASREQMPKSTRQRCSYPFAVGHRFRESLIVFPFVGYPTCRRHESPMTLTTRHVIPRFFNFPTHPGALTRPEVIFATGPVGTAEQTQRRCFHARSAYQAESL